MNILIVDPCEQFSRSAQVSLANYLCKNAIFTLFNGFTGVLDFDIDIALFRIPSITWRKDVIQARSKTAVKCLKILKRVGKRKVLHTVCPRPYPFWFYQIGTDEPAPSDILFHPFDPKTNVFRGHYIAPDWRLLLDSLIVEKAAIPGLDAALS